jgi:hypothetical protein
MAGEAVDEVVLAAVGLVGDHDDVAPGRQHGVAVALLGRHELLDGREHDATAGWIALPAGTVTPSPQALHCQRNERPEDHSDDGACQREPESPAQALYQVVLEPGEGGTSLRARRSPGKGGATT